MQETSAILADGGVWDDWDFPTSLFGPDCWSCTIAPRSTDLTQAGLSALLGHGYTVDNRAQPEMATFGVFRRRVPPIAMQNRRLPLDHWGQVVVRSDFR